MRIPTLPPNVPADGPMVQPPFVTLPEDSTQNNTLFNEDAEDNVGSLYYVVAVIFIYGFSIVLMIASHIRKNQQDNQLRTYLKEMALLRKKDRREKILGRMTTLNATNVVCSNLHNTASGTGALTTNVGSGQPLISSGNGSISRGGQQPVSAGCTFPHVGGCPYGIHVAAVNVTQNHTNTNSQNVSTHGHHPKNSQPSFLHECVVNCTNPPLVPAAPPPAIGESNAPQCESNCSTLPVAPFNTATNNATNTATSNNGNNNCTTSSSSSSSSSSVSTTTTTAVVSTPFTSSATSNAIISTTVACVPARDSATSSVPFAKCMHQQQQHYMNHPQKIDEAQEIMLLQTQLTQIQLHQKQQQQQQQQQQLPQQQPNNRCVDPIVPLEPQCINEKANQDKIPNETNNKILSENVIT